jgi:hypothetical protein
MRSTGLGCSSPTLHRLLKGTDTCQKDSYRQPVDSMRTLQKIRELEPWIAAPSGPGFLNHISQQVLRYGVVASISRSQAEH